MAGSLIQNMIAFTGLVVNTPTSLPHGLNVNGAGVLPKLLAPSVGGFTITADATNITVTRTSAAANGNVNVYAQYWFAVGLDAFAPFVVASNVGAGPGPGQRQTFQYVATGSESAAGFDIVFPVDRPDTNFEAVVTGGPMATNGVVMAFTVQSQTVHKITVVPSAKPSAGDVYFVTVEQLT